MRYGPAVALVLAVALGTGIPKSSQALPAVQMGVLASLNSSTLAGGLLSDVADFDRRVTFGGGLFAMMPLAEVVSAQVEVRYTGKGAESKFDAVDENGNKIGEGTFTYKLEYVTVPILLRLRLPVQTRVRPAIFAGPELAFRASSKGDVEIDEQVAPVDPVPDQDLDVKSFDLGVTAGAGLEIGAGRGVILLDARYTFGTSKVFKAAGASDDKNRALSFSVGYGF